MSTLAIRWLTFFVVFSGASYAQIDAYGGSTQATCTAEAFFSIAKIGKHFWFCTPSGHPFFFQGPYAVIPLDTNGGPDGIVPPGTNNYNYVQTLYGDANITWSKVEAARIAGMGFNGLATYENFYIFPQQTNSAYPGDHSFPTKLPSMLIERPMYYGMFNSGGYLDQAIKDLWFGIANVSGGYVQRGNYIPTGEGDYFDSRFDTELSSLLNPPSSLSYEPEYFIPRSSYRAFTLGVAVEDSDEIFGLDEGWDFPSYPVGHNSPHIGWLFATGSPMQTANAAPDRGRPGQVYFDTNVYAKQHFMESMKAKYGTISALNAAWGTGGYYTTFGSSGTTYTGESFGTGNGSTVTFSHTLANANSVSKFSVQVFATGASGADLAVDGSNNLRVTSASHSFASAEVGMYIHVKSGQGWLPGYYQISSVSSGAAMLFNSPAPGGTTGGSWVAVSAGGDLGNASLYSISCTATSTTGCIWGPDLAGTIDYTTGVMLITFANAPISGSAITVNYVQNGWGLGTGLMDEDGRNSAWWGVTAACVGSGCPYNTLAGVNLDLQTDLNNFLYDMAFWFFSHSKAGVNSWTGGSGGSSMSGVLYLGPDSMFGTWSIPSRSQVLQAAAAAAVPVIIAGGAQLLNQSMLDFVHANAGDIPLIQAMFKTANADSIFSFSISSISCASQVATVTTARNHTFSAGSQIQISGVSVTTYDTNQSALGSGGTYWTVASVPGPNQFTFNLGQSCPSGVARSGIAFFADNGGGGFASQSARGASVLSDVTTMMTQAYTESGTKPWIGYSWWRWNDDPGEQRNWGLTTTLDNIYDGSQDCVSASKDSLGYRRGGEPARYGDLITSINAANGLWLEQMTRAAKR